TVRGRLGERLAMAFHGITLVPHNGSTELVGELADQTQLHGLLTRIRDLGLELESVSVSPSDPPPADKDASNGERPPCVGASRGSCELAARESDGLHVQLLWDPIAAAITVGVEDLRAGDRFRLAVAREHALDAFYPPFAYPH